MQFHDAIPAALRGPDPVALAAKATHLLEEGRPGAACPLVRALRPAGASPRVAAELEARLLSAQRLPHDAIAVLDAEISARGPTASLLILRAEVCLLADRLVEAALSCADAVILDRDNGRANELLGRVLLQLGRPSDAIACLRKALQTVTHPEFAFLDLARALDARGEPEEAETVLTAGIAQVPSSPALRSAAILRRVRAGDLEGAIAQATLAREQAVINAAGFALLGQALQGLGRRDEAADSYACAWKLEPENTCFRHLAAAHGRARPGDRAPPDYVRALFDSYPGVANEHQAALGAFVPDVLSALAAQPSVAGGPVLDLGCGTGLLAVGGARCSARPWVGVDLSALMLAESHATSLYAELHEMDLVEYLVAERRRFPLIAACDVLCYFGPLPTLLAAIRERASPQGRLIFTFEALPPGDEPVHLNPTGRYAHGEAHVAAAAAQAGWSLVSIADAGGRLNDLSGASYKLAVLENVA